MSCTSSMVLTWQERRWTTTITDKEMYAVFKIENKFNSII